MVYDFCKQEILNQFMEFTKGAVQGFIDGTENVKSINVIFIIYLIDYFPLPKSYVNLLQFCFFLFVLKIEKLLVRM